MYTETRKIHLLKNSHWILLNLYIYYPDSHWKVVVSIYDRVQSNQVNIIFFLMHILWLKSFVYLIIDKIYFVFKFWNFYNSFSSSFKFPKLKNLQTSITLSIIFFIFFLLRHLLSNHPNFYSESSFFLQVLRVSERNSNLTTRRTWRTTSRWSLTMNIEIEI